MKIATLLFALVAMALPLRAAPEDPVGETLVALEKRSWEAWKNRDGGFFREFLSDDHVEMGFGGPTDKAAVVAVVSSPICEVKSYAVDRFKVTLLDESTADVTYFAEQDTVCFGEIVPSPAWATSVYVKRGGRWANALYQQTQALKAPARPPSPLWGRLAPGPHGVGVSVLRERDATRAAFQPGEPGRPIPITVWYPAMEAPGERLTLRDYIELGGGVDDFVKEPASNGIAASLVENVLASRLFAVRDAPRLDGRFPLVLFLHANPWSASVLSEYLASHGFVVAAFESKGAREPAYRLSRENLDAMVRDAQWTVERMRRERYVGAKLGIVGMSNGAIAAAALQLAGTVPDAIVSLDGGIGETAGATYLKERSGTDVRKLTVPILHLYTPDNPHLELQPLRSYDFAPRTLASLKGLRHRDFLAYAELETLMPGAFGPAPRNAAAGFEAACKYTERFLRWHLAGDAKARRILEATPQAAGFPAESVAVERLPAAR
jgi:hypothetical protein